MSRAAFPGLSRAVGLLSQSSLRSVPRQASRSVHSTGTKSMGEHASHSSYEEYMHSEHMYNLDKMKYQKLKMTLLVWGGVAFGIAVPVYAVIFQQKKTASS